MSVATPTLLVRIFAYCAVVGYEIESVPSGQCLAVGNISIDNPPVLPWVEDPLIPVRQSSIGRAINTKQSTLSQDALRQYTKVGSENWHASAISYSASGGGHD